MFNLFQKYAVWKRKSLMFKVAKWTPDFYLSICTELHPQSHLLHFDVFVVIDDIPDIVGTLLNQDVEAGRGGDANAGADQHDVPGMEDCDVPDVEDFDDPS